MVTSVRKMRTHCASAIAVFARSASSAARGNSGTSSRKSTPRCASEISPGRGQVPPPTSAIAVAVWCGARNGRAPQRTAAKSVGSAAGKKASAPASLQAPKAASKPAAPAPAPAAKGGSEDDWESF